VTVKGSAFKEIEKINKPFLRWRSWTLGSYLGGRRTDPGQQSKPGRGDGDRDWSLQSIIRRDNMNQAMFLRQMDIADPSRFSTSESR
jgi:hypothetical protein